MSLWRQLTHGFRNLFGKAGFDQDVADEVRQYLDEATAASIASGLSAVEARRAALREIGSMTSAQEQVRSYGWENVLRGFAADLRYAARQLSGNPGFAIVSVITLALGIGASTAIFSAVNPILFEPLPYPHPDRITMIWKTNQGARSPLAFGTYRELAARSHSFDALAVFQPWQPTITGGTHPERLEGQDVSLSFFRAIGVSPVLGRDFQSSEDVFHGPKVVILGDSLWHRLFKADPAIVGHQITLDGDLFTIIGVMPHGYENVLSPTVQIWTPIQYDTRQIATSFDTVEWGNHLRMVGRLKAVVNREQGINELNEIARTPWPQFPRPPQALLRRGLIVDSLQADIARTVKPALIAVMGAVILVLAIACVNVVNLLLGRSAQRRGEFAVRAALGASRARIIRQLITESLLLAALGGVLGMTIAFGGVRALIALSPPGLPRLGAISVDKAAFLFGLGLTTLIGLITGLVPALHVSRERLHSGLQQGSRVTVGDHSWTRRTLVIAEVALALVLMVSAGLLLRSTQRLLAVSPGFNPSHLLTMQVQTSGHQFDDLPSAPTAGDNARQRFFEQALEAVRRVPGVQQAAFTSVLPLSNDPARMTTYGAHFEKDDPQGGRDVFRYAVSSDYCQTMGIPLISGRFLDEGDASGAPQAALISESLAKSEFPNDSALGKRLHLGPDRPWYTVVGIVGDVKQTSLAINDPDAVYIPEEQSFADDTMSFVIRAHGDTATLAPVVENAIWSADKDQPIVRVATMDDWLAVSEAERRFVLRLFEVFGFVALTLAAVGIYGILSGSVTERTREIGVRTALGATRADIMALVLGDGMRLTIFGVAIGLAGAAASGHMLITLLFGVSGLDPITYLGVILLLAAVAAIACSVPAWRAARVDPSITLRAE
jgi:putative ABC transport system permease protein